MGWIDQFVQALWAAIYESGVWLILGFALAGVVHTMIPRGFLEKQLGGRGIKPIAKASLMGIPLPLCSCGVIPVAAGLHASGASKGASAAFTISTPQTGEESVPLTWALFGPVFALARPVIAVCTAFTAGLLIDRFTPPRKPLESAPGTGPAAATRAAAAPLTGLSVGQHADFAGPDVQPPAAAAPSPASCCSSQEPGTKACCGGSEPTTSCCGGSPAPAAGASCCSSTNAPAPRGWLARTGEAARYGFHTLVVDIAPWLLVGLLGAAAVSAFVPESWLSTWGSGPLAYVIALVIGIPLYVCATSTTVLAWSLVAAGLNPGAALVLLLAGPATNAATIAWVIKDLGVRALVIYLGSIAVFALGCGVTFDLLFSGLVTLKDMAEGHEHAAASSPVMVAGGVVLIAMLAWGLWVRSLRAQRATHAEAQTAPAPGECCSNA